MVGQLSTVSTVPPTALSSSEERKEGRSQASGGHVEPNARCPVCRTAFVLPGRGQALPPHLRREGRARRCPGSGLFGRCLPACAEGLSR